MFDHRWRIPSRRYRWLDIAKGIGIVLVVFGHTILGLGYSNILGPSRAADFVSAFIYAFHMPLFFFISGALVWKSLDRKPLDFVADKIRTLVYPYVVWSIITLVLKQTFKPFTNSENGLADIPLLLYAPVAQFWFLYALFLLLLVFFVLRRLGASPVCLAGATFILAVLPKVIFPSLGQYWPPALEIAYNAPFVAGGIFFAQYFGLSVWSTGNSTKFALAILGLSIAALAGIFPDLRNNTAIATWLAFAGIAGVLLVSMSLEGLSISSVFSFLGRYSLEIYVAHTIASAAARAGLIYSGVVNPVMHLLFGTLTGILVPLCLAFVVKRIGFRYAFTWPKAQLSQPAPAP